MCNITDVKQAKLYLQENLPRIEAVANHILSEAGFHDVAIVSLQREPFPARYYETFKLPAGVYETLRITIGSGKGHNWWCVVFPALCVSTTVAEYEEAAHCAGLSDTLTGTLAGEKPYEPRFLILDTIGRLENFLSE